MNVNEAHRCPRRSGIWRSRFRVHVGVVVRRRSVQNDGLPVRGAVPAPSMVGKMQLA